MFSLHSKKQQGSSLTTSLIILIVLMGLLVSSTRNSSLQLRMAYNITNYNMAFQSAEAALKEAEDWIMAQTTAQAAVTSCSLQPCIIEESTWQPEDQSATWWAANSAQYSGSLSSVNTMPRYVIEYVKYVPDEAGIGSSQPSGTYYYRITSRGTGSTDNSVSILQTMFARRY